MAGGGGGGGGRGVCTVGPQGSLTVVSGCFT